MCTISANSGEEFLVGRWLLDQSAELSWLRGRSAEMSGLLGQDAEMIGFLGQSSDGLIWLTSWVL